ncbi:hypothetical protein M0804_000297 [Polistes exclamans]|nr:hypothetical protein M0804_000297 [Polistes exclamans]
MPSQARQVGAGFRGKHCEENIDDCPGNLCQNGATCVDRVNEYSCLCPPTFTGTQCELDVDECSTRPSVCHNGATCTNSHGSYSCICVNGWTGPDCSINIDDCAGAACFNGATCIDRVGSFYCQCTYGKTEQNVTFIYIVNQRSSHVELLVTVRSLKQEEKALANGVSSNEQALRISKESAGASAARTWNTMVVVDDDDDDNDNDDDDDNAPPPLRQSLLCHLDDACTSNPCHEGANCDTSPINGSFACSCATGYKGVDCSEDIDECKQGSPCEHDGICVNTPGSFACNCTQGFTGPRCETNVNECESHPCQNDGSCLDDPGTFRCVCMPGDEEEEEEEEEGEGEEEVWP